MKIKLAKLLAVLTVLAFIGLPRVASQQPVTVETLKQFVAAFKAHDIDAVMSFFADDCELMMPRGPALGPAVCWQGRGLKGIGDTLRRHPRIALALISRAATLVG